MARIFAYCDSPIAGTGFGRSAQHVLGALHEAGHEIVQLAVNHDPTRTQEVPWELHAPTHVAGDPYGLNDLARIVLNRGPFDMVWVTFDPEVPFSYFVQGIEPKARVIELLTSLRQTNPGLKVAGWFPIDGGPLSDFELTVLGGNQWIDLVVTMADHVHELVKWSLELKGKAVDMATVKEKVHVVPHGVDMGLYRIASDEERTAAKVKLGYPADSFLVVQVERNQQRKQVWQAFEVLEQLRKMRPGQDVRLYQHMFPDEDSQGCQAGWNLPNIAPRYGLKPGEDVRWQDRKFTEEEMVGIVYAAADVVLSVSSGEGFQYPLWEALACGRRVVAPRDSARKAWLGLAPGAFLYATHERGIVLRRGYDRRMNFADPRDAARTIAKMVDDRQKHRETPEASRAWVANRADHHTVTRWWVEQMARLENELHEERKASKVVVREVKADHVVGVRANPGFGDLCMMAPGTRALRESGSVTLALPKAPGYLQLAQAMDMADYYQTEPSVPLAELGTEVRDVSSLWTPEHRSGWSDPDHHRALVVSDFIGNGAMRNVRAMLPKDLMEKTRAHLRQHYGVEPRDCVAVAPQSGVPSRSWSEGHTRALVDRLVSLGHVPVIVGKRQLGVEPVGALNLTGKTDLAALMAILGTVRAAICVDSGALHFAQAMGTPTVGLFPLFPGETRLGFYNAAYEIVEPPIQALGPETWPPGKDAQQRWVDTIQPDAVLEAFNRMIGEATEEPVVLGPEG